MAGNIGSRSEHLAPGSRSFQRDDGLGHGLDGGQHQPSIAFLDPHDRPVGDCPS